MSETGARLLSVSASLALVGTGDVTSRCPRDDFLALQLVSLSIGAHWDLSEHPAGSITFVRGSIGTLSTHMDSPTCKSVLAIRSRNDLPGNKQGQEIA